MRSTLLSLLILLTACEPEPSEVTCATSQVYVADYCLECGDAGGCEDTGPACLEPCSDTGFDCIDGARWERLCD